MILAARYHAHHPHPARDGSSDAAEKAQESSACDNRLLGHPFQENH